MPSWRPSFRHCSLRSLRTPAVALSLLAAAALSAHCGGGGGSGGGDPPPGGDDAGDATADSPSGETLPETSPGDAPADARVDAPADTPPDASPVTCSATPTFGTPLRLNHNPDALRSISNGALTMLADGRLMAVFLEALDTGSRYGLYARIVDPTTHAIGPDQRLDVDADGLNSGTGLDVGALANGALYVQYWPTPGSGARRLRIYTHEKWSPEINPSSPIVESDTLGLADASDGTVLVVRAHAAAPSGAGIVYRPDEGGAAGSWSALQTLDLDAASGTPTLSPFVMPDGRYLVLVWQGAGGPSVRLRSVSGAWSAPGPRAEIGAVDASPAVRLLADGSIVLVALEGSGDTRRTVTSTWTEASGWTTARLLSKTVDTNGVVPFIGGRADPFLYTVSATEAEYVAWVAGCTGAAKDCQFHPIARRYTSAAGWTDPVDLAVGTVTTGPDGLRVDALDGETPVVSRTSSDGTSIQLKARLGPAAFGPLASILDGSPLFGAGASAAARFFGGARGLWSIASRVTAAVDGGTSTPLPSAIGKLAPGGSPAASWGVVSDGAGAEMHGFSPFSAYVDGAGGFTLAMNDAVDTTGKAYPLLAHLSGSATATPEVQRVVLSDELSALFANAPSRAPRPGLDKSAIFVVNASVALDGGTGHRLRAYAYDGAGAVKPQLLANENQSPRAFGQGLLTYGCGGAILYATDPLDGSHGLQLVLVQ